MEKFTLFYGGPFSQWRHSNFEIDGVRYNTAEQWMMAEKARTFGDTTIESMIMRSSSPAEQKDLGKKVRGFNKARWEAIEDNGKPYCWNVVYKGNKAKYTQNLGFKDELFKTVGTTLVEASSTDTIWGIGLGEEDPKALDRSQWRGTNWLGDVLTQLREDLIKEEK